MGLKKDYRGYNAEGYTKVKQQIKKVEKIRRKAMKNGDVNKMTKATQKRFELENVLRKYESYFQIKENTEEKKNGDKVVRISDIVSKNFHPLFSVSNPVKEPYRVFKGGRSSLKSSAISIKLVNLFMQDEKANVVCFRKVGKYLANSVYEQIKWAIYMLGLENEFIFLRSPMKIIHKKTETAFYFYGVDDPLKIKSHKIARGHVIALWFEEAAEFEGEEEIDIVTDSFIREDLPGDQQVEIYFSYNPPKNPYVWINEWAEEKKQDDDYYIHHSDYTEDSLGVLSQQFISKVEKIRKTDPDYWRWMYKGHAIGLGNLVYNYNLFNQVDDIPEDERVLFADIAIDGGYSVSATTFLYLAYTAKGNVYLLDTYYYSPRGKVQKKAPSDFAEELWKFIQDNGKKFGLYIDTYTIDSAEAALRNEFFKSKGIPLTPAIKKRKEKMIENVESLLAQDRVHVLKTERNKIFLEEHKKYQWDEDSLEPGKEPKVLKEDDHTCDAFQYFINNNLAKLNLKA